MLIANPTLGIVITEVDVQQHERTVCLHAKNNNDDTFCCKHNKNVLS